MPKTQNIYIAVIDDDESLCRSLSRLLRAVNFQPITYHSAEAFLADAKHPQFDCLILDIQLGGISGLELSQRLAAVMNVPPIVFITAHDDDATRSQAEASGCAGYFRKTDSGADILTAIQRAVGMEKSDTTHKNRSASSPKPPR